MRLPEKYRPFFRWFFGFKRARKAEDLPKLSITVVIPAYNEARTIAATIRSIRDQTHRVDRLIVVDDCSTDRTGDIAREMGVEVLRTPKNQGSKAMAQNHALTHVKTDIIINVDADTILAADAIENALMEFRDERIMIVCGLTVPANIRTIWERGRFIEYMYALSVWKPAQEHSGAMLVASGCFCLIRTEKLRELGGFKTRTITEDLDLTWEAIEAGYDVVFAPNAVCYPVEPATFKVLVNQLERWFRGYFQSIAVRGNMFRRSWKLAAFVYFYTIWFVLSPFLILSGLWAFTGSFLVAAGTSLAGILLFAGLPSFIQAWRLGMLGKALVNFPFLFLMQPVNLTLYLYCMFKELVLRERLTVWKAGH